MTTEQVQLVHRYADSLTLIYDADEAGSGATLRGLDIALENGLDVHIVELPEGHDPDSFIRKEGREAFVRQLEMRKSFIEYKAQRLLVQGPRSGPEQKTSAIRSIVQSIAKIPDELKRNLFIKDVAQKFDLYESVLHRELEKWAPRSESSRPQPVRARPPASLNQKSTGEEPSAGPIPVAEADILRLMLENTPEVMDYVFSEITLLDFHHPKSRRLAEVIHSLQAEQGLADLTHLLDHLADPELRNLATDLVLGRFEVSKGWQEREIDIEQAESLVVAQAAVYRIKRETLMRTIRENLIRLKGVSVGSDEARHYSSLHLELQRRLKELDEAHQPGTRPRADSVSHEE